MGRHDEGRGLVDPKRKPKNMCIGHNSAVPILLVSQAFGGPFMKALNRIRF